MTQRRLPRYPVYIPTKGRAHACQTAGPRVVLGLGQDGMWNRRTKLPSKSKRVRQPEPNCRNQEPHERPMVTHMLEPKHGHEQRAFRTDHGGGCSEDASPRVAVSRIKVDRRHRQAHEKRKLHAPG